MTTIVTRQAKGIQLTYSEMDTNLTNLNTDKLEKDISADLSTTYGISVKNTSNSYGPLKYFIAFYNYLGTLIGGISHDALENVGITSKNGIKLGTGTSGTTRVDIDSAGNVNIATTGARITGDFSNATLANRVMFQTSTVNGATSVAAIPNGTGTYAGFASLYGSSGNYSYLEMKVDSSSGQLAIVGNAIGTGTQYPMTFYTGGSESFRCATDGTFTVSKAAGLGYGTGAGGTVTQATSKSATVTLNKPTGQITTHNAALAAGATVGFILNNSILGVTDVIVVNTTNGNGVNVLNYRAEAHVLAAGTGYIKITNTSGSNLSEALAINFAIIKGAVA